MAVFERMYDYIQSLDQRQWHRFLALVLALVLVLSSSIIYFYYRRINAQKQALFVLNDERETVKRILSRARAVQKQRAAVNAMLKEDPDFKLGAFIRDLLAKLGLNDKQYFVAERYSSSERDDNFRESVRTLELSGLNMKQLTQLLEAIEQKERVYVKELDITKPKPNVRAINVVITVGTLQPKTATPEPAESSV